MGLVRLGSGRDAADVAFATIVGSGPVLPQHGPDALSADSGASDAFSAAALA